MALFAWIDMNDRAELLGYRTESYGKRRAGERLYSLQRISDDELMQEDLTLAEIAVFLTALESQRA